MKVHVELYSQLRDLAGAAELNIDLSADATVTDLLGKIYEEAPALRSRDKSILVSAGVEFVEPADIGLEGKKIKHEGRVVDAFYFCVGGAVGKHAAIARPVGYRVPATEVPAALERLLSSYLEERIPGENLRSYFSRHDSEEIRARLAGESLTAVERDVPAMAIDGD